jgi:hypothetical protein
MQKNVFPQQTKTNIVVNAHFDYFLEEKNRFLIEDRHTVHGLINYIEPKQYVVIQKFYL